MADGNRRLNILLEVADRISAPFRRMAGVVGAMAAPLNRARAALARFANASGLTRVAASVTALGARLSTLGATAKATAGKLALLTGGGALAAMWSFNRLFVRPAADAEQLVLGLRSVAGSTEAAQAEFNRLSKFADSASVDITGVADAYKAIRMAGGQASDKLLAKMGDIAAGTKKSYGEIGEAMASVMRGDLGAASSIDPSIKAQEIGNKVLFTWIENGKKMHAVVARQNKQLLAETMAALWAKKHAGAAEAYGQTWDGMLGRIGALWKKFQRMIMEGGAFAALREKLSGIVAKIEEWADNGQLEEWAARISAEMVALFDRLEEGFKEGWKWAEELAAKIGGWGNLILTALTAVTAILVGPLFLALVMTGKAVVALGFSLIGPLKAAFFVVGKAVLSLGATIMATPLGWFMAACAVIAGLAYVIWDQWEPISKYFEDLWGEIKAAFNEGWIEGIWAVLTKFNPMKLIADGINGLIKYLTGIDLFAEGDRLFSGLWDGIQSVWGKITGWIKQAWQGLIGFLPDFVKKELGLTVVTGVDANAPATALPGQMPDAAGPEQSVAPRLTEGTPRPGQRSGFATDGDASANYRAGSFPPVLPANAGPRPGLASDGGALADYRAGSFPPALPANEAPRPGEKSGFASGGGASADYRGGSFPPALPANAAPPNPPKLSPDDLGGRIAAAINQAGDAMVAALGKVSIKSEVTIRAYMPQSFQVEGQTSQGTLRIDRQSLGPMM